MRIVAKTMRVHQWVKSLFVLLPLVFGQALLDRDAVLRSVAAFFLFSFAASSIYILNDLGDIESDRKHPTKRHRPIPSGAIAESAAKKLLAVLLFAVAVGSVALSLISSFGVALSIAGYLALNVAYSRALKKIAFLDVACIAAGFVLRTVCGSHAAMVPLSEYLVSVTFLLSLFLGFGKRAHEYQGGQDAINRRKALRGYSKATLQIAMGVTAIATLVLYVIYTLDPHTARMFGSRHLVWTSPLAAAGMYRFLQIAKRSTDADSPTDGMLRDGFFLGILGIWAATVIAIVYFSA